MNKVIFDSSALLAIMYSETGYEEIEKMLPYSSMSIINVTEVITVLARENMPKEEIEEAIAQLIPEIIPYDMNAAMFAGNMINDIIPYGLSLGDRACIATAMKLSREVYTADKAWGKVEIENLKINLIR